MRGRRSSRFCGCHPECRERSGTVLRLERPRERLVRAEADPAENLEQTVQHVGQPGSLLGCQTADGQVRIDGQRRRARIVGHRKNGPARTVVRPRQRVHRFRDRAERETGRGNPQPHCEQRSQGPDDPGRSDGDRAPDAPAQRLHRHRRRRSHGRHDRVEGEDRRADLRRQDHRMEEDPQQSQVRRQIPGSRLERRKDAKRRKKSRRVGPRKSSASCVSMARALPTSSSTS